ncbi:MAG: DnaJ C-terminal domain-containing protein, partial [Candidatus Methanoperedens sp.]|nr:DnaJ C-terminal domain-containing protein [Candidatus Methanoperedens sp.]
IFGFSAHGGQGGQSARGGQGRGRAKRGGDIQVLLAIEFKEAVFGAERDINLKKNIVCDRCKAVGAEPGSKIETCKTCGGTGRIIRTQRTIFGSMRAQTACPDCGGEGKAYSQKCSKCHGSGIIQEISGIKVKIPAGSDDGETIRLSGQGEQGERGAPAGDLYLKIRVNPDIKFKRDGYNILSKAEISFAQAALGDKIEIPTVDGNVKLKIPEGAQSGKVFRLSGRGIPRLRASGRGDHLVEIIVKTPTGLSRKQKEMLKELGI